MLAEMRKHPGRPVHPTHPFLSPNFFHSRLAETGGMTDNEGSPGATWNRPDELKILVACRG